MKGVQVMVFSKHLLLLAVLQGALIILPLLVQPQVLSDSISIDCGISDGSSYVDETTNIGYVSDTNFTDAGENNDVAAIYKGQRQLWNVRSFPEGTRNCYTLKPAGGTGTKYLIRARFLYGNYDHKGQPPTFDLHLGVDLWDTVKIEEESSVENKEIIHVLSTDHIHVCLVNTNNGIPFISALELRVLDNNIYKTEPGSSLKLFKRLDFSLQINEIKERYEDDVYDRLWELDSYLGSWTYLNNSLTNKNSIFKNDYKLPITVMNTAFTLDGAENMGISWDQRQHINSTLSYYFYMHFRELKELKTDERREFDIYINDEYHNEIAPEYLYEFTSCSTSGVVPDSDGKIEIWMNITNKSTLPPLINAIEIYTLTKLLQQETDQIDANAIMNVKSVYGLKRNWQGDPCYPEAYQWDGLNCSYSANIPPRIVSLNLSSSGLVGAISAVIVDLSMLEYLDLSNNNLRGQVPEFLAQLTSLKVLNLKGNDLTGPIPNALLERSKNGLSLSIDTNPSPTPYCSTGSCRRKNNFVVPLVPSLSGILLLVLLIVATVLWALKRRKRRQAMDIKVEMAESNEDADRSFVAKKQRFTYSEIQRITNNFQTVLGEGGFGKVYHGHLNGIEVAVKMLSPSSIQGYRQFHAELKLLLRVHHKNLTTLFGYCNEEANIGLIYEYMAMGNLRSHLFGSTDRILSWIDRLKIAIDTAQGLEYLHNGCKPPIVHRDVKSTNILLNDKFQAKLGDFGLSKIFPCESDKHISSYTHTLGFSTSVAGTPGYLDPEYYVSNWLNERSDVYSFGVLLLELITARPVLPKTERNTHITEWVSSMLANGDVKSIIDPRLEGWDLDINTVWKAIEIAMSCVSETSTKRPTMSCVAVELKECLTTELTRKHGLGMAELKNLAEMMTTNSINSGQLRPLAR